MNLGEVLVDNGEQYRLTYGQLDCKGCAFNTKGPRAGLCSVYGMSGSKSCVVRVNPYQLVFGKFKKIVRRVK